MGWLLRFCFVFVADSVCSLSFFAQHVLVAHVLQSLEFVCRQSARQRIQERRKLRNSGAMPSGDAARKSDGDGVNRLMSFPAAPDDDDDDDTGAGADADGEAFPAMNDSDQSLDFPTRSRSVSPIAAMAASGGQRRTTSGRATPEDFPGERAVLATLRQGVAQNTHTNIFFCGVDGQSGPTTNLCCSCWGNHTVSLRGWLVGWLVGG